MNFPRIDHKVVPEFTSTQMTEVDRAMIEDFGITPIQAIENAGRALAIVARAPFIF